MCSTGMLSLLTHLLGYCWSAHTPALCTAQSCSARTSARQHFTRLVSHSHARKCIALPYLISPSIWVITVSQNIVQERTTIRRDKLEKPHLWCCSSFNNSSSLCFVFVLACGQYHPGLRYQGCSGLAPGNADRRKSFFFHVVSGLAHGVAELPGGCGGTRHGSPGADSHGYEGSGHVCLPYLVLCRSALPLSWSFLANFSVVIVVHMPLTQC